jgi:hypothetical protein
MGTSSDWISAAIEALLVGGGLVVMKVFRNNDRKTPLKLTVMDVFGCMLAGLIFGAFTTLWLTEVRCKRILVLLIVAYLIAAFADALIRRAKRSPDEKSVRTRLP